MKTTVTFDPSLYVVVPRLPTDEMVRAMKPLTDGPPTHRWQWIWNTLVAAAPPLPEQPQGEPPVDFVAALNTALDKALGSMATNVAHDLDHSGHDHSKWWESVKNARLLRAIVAEVSAPAGDPAVRPATDCKHVFAGIENDRVSMHCVKCGVHPDDVKDSSSIRAAESVEPVPAVSASVDLPGSLALAGAVREGKWPHTMDARVWADEFCKQYVGIQNDVMIGWFANAIMAGYDTARMRAADAVRDASLLTPARAVGQNAAERITKAFGIRAAGDHATVPAVRASVDSRNREHFKAWLCYAQGESDLPSARLCRTASEIREFLADEWFGDPNDPDLNDTMDELDAHDWSDEAWKVEFEIGSIKIEKVSAWQTREAKP